MANATTTSVHITQLEADLLNKIYNSCFHDGEDPIGNAVWSEVDTQSEKGVMSSLIKKGLCGFDEVKKKGKSVESTVWILEAARVPVEALAKNNWTVMSTSNSTPVKPSTTKSKSKMATADKNPQPAKKGIFNRADVSVKGNAQTMSKPEFVEHYTETTSITAEKAGEAWHDLRRGAKTAPQPAPAAKAASTKVAKDPANAPKPGKTAKTDKVAKKAAEKEAKAQEKIDAAKAKADAKAAKEQEKADAKAAKVAERAAAKELKAKEGAGEKEAKAAARKVESDAAKAVRTTERAAAREKAKAERAQARAVEDASKVEEKQKAKEAAAQAKADAKVAKTAEREKTKEEAKAAKAIAKDALAAERAEVKKQRVEQKLKDKEEKAAAREADREAKRLAREEAKANRVPRVKVIAPLPDGAQAVLDTDASKSEKMRDLFENFDMGVAAIAHYTNSHYSFTYGVIERLKTDRELSKQKAAAPAPAAVEAE